MQTASPCKRCMHFHFDRNLVNGLRSCEAFGHIGDAVFFGTKLHEKPLQGDGGIQFKAAIGSEIERRIRSAKIHNLRLAHA